MSERPQGGARGAGDILAIGFGTTVALWAVGYLARLPVVLAPPAVVLALLVAVPAGAGFIAGRRGIGSVARGAAAGAVSGLLNLLVLGSFLATNDRTNGLVPSAAFWVPGSILFASVLTAAGTALGIRARSVAVVAPNWTGAFARVAVCATFLLLVAGGLVTSNQAGLAVVDWPRSYGYNMFLYPFSRMTGGIYYEHAHRLLGALVGLTTVTLAVHLLRVESRAWVRRMAGGAVLLVIVQGVLGGLRVTEKAIALAVVHGVTAQLFFSLLVGLAAVTSTAWTSARERRASPSAGTDIRMTTIAIAALVVQIVLGALQRHLAWGLMLHVVSAFVVAGLTVSAGARGWGLHPDEPILKRAGLTVLYVTGLQLMLGFSAWIARGAFATGAMTEGWKVVLTTLHQGTGAVLLASTVCLRFWLARLLEPAR